MGCNKVIVGNGLVGINERINAINGEVVYTSKESQGFCIDISIPFQEENYEEYSSNAC